MKLWGFTVVEKMKAPDPLWSGSDLVPMYVFVVRDECSAPQTVLRKCSFGMSFIFPSSCACVGPQVILTTWAPTSIAPFLRVIIDLEGIIREGGPHPFCTSCGIP